jgi:hypothetical protein
MASKSQEQSSSTPSSTSSSTIIIIKKVKNLPRAHDATGANLGLNRLNQHLKRFWRRSHHEFWKAWDG